MKKPRKPKASEVPDNGCLAACVAYILGLPMKKIPDFFSTRTADEQNRKLQRFLNKMGYFALFIDEDHSIPVNHIAAGPCTRDGDHAIVVKGNRVVYNCDHNFWPRRINERIVIIKK